MGLTTCNWWPVVPEDEKPKIHLDIQKTESPPSGVQSTQKAIPLSKCAIALLQAQVHKHLQVRASCSIILLPIYLNT